MQCLYNNLFLKLNAIICTKKSNRALYGEPVHFYVYDSRYGMFNKITRQNVYHNCSMVYRIMTTS